jgi:hypothetical protein
MPITDEKIIATRKEIEERINNAQAQIETWKGVIAQCKAKRELLDELAGGNRGKGVSAGLTLIGKFSNMETTPAVLQVIMDHSNTLLSPGEITKILLDEGFVPKTKNWKSAVYVACDRLAEKNKVVRAQKRGVKAYMAMAA